MRTGLRVLVLLVIILLVCAPGSAVALTFIEAPGSPYSTTDQHFVPSTRGLLGGVAAGDFNGDGVSDLAVANSTGIPAFSPGESVTVLLGQRDGGLTMSPSSPVELYSGGIYYSYGAVATDDFNNDGNLDLAVVDNIHYTISILLGDGAGNLRLSGTLIHFSGGEPRTIAVGDFNGDGVKDLAFASGDSVNVLLGDGSGGFAPAPESPFAPAGYATSVAAGNFNSDAYSDLAVTTSSDQVAIYLATGGGRFHEAEGSPLPTGEGPAAIVATDLNGDGKADVAIANASSDNVTVLLGDGSGGFAPAPASPFAAPASADGSAGMLGFPDSIGAGDFNGDGDIDLAVANFNGSSNNIAVLRGDGHGGFTNAVGSPFPANGNPGPLVVGDFNGDGRSDLAVANPFQGVVTVLQNTTVEGQGAPSHSPDDVQGAPTTTSTPVFPTAPTRSQILKLIARQLGPSGDWARLRPSAKSASFTFGFKALEAGTAVIDWYAAQRGRRQAQGARAEPMILASGRLTFSAAATKVMRLTFTRAGRLLWKGPKQLQLTAKGTFTPIGTTPVVAVRTVALRGRR